jgi:hypothetical protein
MSTTERPLLRGIGVILRVVPGLFPEGALTPKALLIILLFPAFGLPVKTR